MKYCLNYELPVLEKGSTTPVMYVVPFELSAGGVWFCRANNIAMTEKTGSQQEAVDVPAQTIPYKVKGVVDTSSGIAVQTYKFDSKTRKQHQRTSASEVQYSRGKTLLLKTGKYAAPAYTSSDVWEPKTFKLRVPRWVNNGYILDAMRELFKAFIEFNTTPTTAKQLFPVVKIDKVLYRIPNRDLAPLATKGDPSKNPGIAAAASSTLSTPDSIS